jgi:N-acetylneuraminic acid mutarotase
VQRSTHSLQREGGTWVVSRLADRPGKGFATAASAVVGGELFVFGGLNWDEASQAVQNITASYAFDPVKNAWRTIRPLAQPARGVTAVALDSHQIYIAGGYRDDFTADAVIYDVKADSYRKAQPLPYAAMVALVKLDGFVYCLGGEDKMKSRTDKFFRIPVEELLK